MDKMEHVTKTLEYCYSSHVTAGKGGSRLATHTATLAEKNHQTENVTFPYRQLPHNNVERFVGRSDMFQAMQAHLKPSGTAETQHFCLWGLGGMGKSQTALAFANLYGEHFDAIFWVRAASDTLLNQSFSSIAVNLGLRKATEQLLPEENRDAIHGWLRNCSKLIQYVNLPLH